MDDSVLIEEPEAVFFQFSTAYYLPDIEKYYSKLLQFKESILNEEMVMGCSTGKTQIVVKRGSNCVEELLFSSNDVLLKYTLCDVETWKYYCTDFGTGTFIMGSINDMDSGVFKDRVLNSALIFEFKL